jgi:hypothetical protein
MVTFAYGDPYAAPVSQGDPGEISHGDLLDKFSTWQEAATTASIIAAHDNAVVYLHYHRYVTACN